MSTSEITITKLTRARWGERRLRRQQQARD
jgi:hypothetical protein